MVGSCAATSADYAYAVIFYKMFVILRQVLGQELVHRVSAYVLRKAGNPGVERDTEERLELAGEIRGPGKELRDDGREISCLRKGGGGEEGQKNYCPRCG